MKGNRKISNEDMDRLVQKVIGEQKWLWDDANVKAANSYTQIGKPKKKYIIEVNEPFVFETTDRDEYHQLVFLLTKIRADYSVDEVKL